MSDAEPRVEIIQPEFEQVVRPDTAVQLLADGFQFTEGPTWYPREQCLLFSDIPADTIYRWTEHDGCALWRRPSNQANGNCTDRDGNLVSCEHGSRSVTRTEADGTVATLVSHSGGKRLNSPNDVVVKSDGSIWFTDPPYGISAEQQEQPANFVFRLDPGADEPVAVADDFSMPNGLCFSPDERFLYIADSDTDIHHIRRFTVRDDGSLAGGEVFVVVAAGIPDGMRMDQAGRLFAAAGEGVHVFGQDGRLLGKVQTPKSASNCAFGEGGTLFITAVDSLWAVALARA